MKTRLAFAWNDANISHIAKHAVTPGETEYVVRNAPSARKIGGGKHLVHGRTRTGRKLQVIFVYPAPDEVDPDSLELSDLIDYSDGTAKVVYVIHAM
jgi:hypothetical protein